MNDKERDLIRFVCDGDIRKAQKQARIVLEGLTTQKDAGFRQYMLRNLDAKGKTLLELPSNLRELLSAEDVSNFPMHRFLLRAEEKDVITKTLATQRAARRLAELGIPYLPTLMLHGGSGGGKTMLARYLAYKTELPFVYVRFSGLVGSLLGSTQSNVGKVFEYARSAPCILCFDEIDAVGMARGQKNDVGEMNRIVIALMQELDMLPNNVIVVGTTNRFDRLDPALVRRFTICHEVLPLSVDEILALAEAFYRYAGVDTKGWLRDWCAAEFGRTEYAAAITGKCTRRLVDSILAESAMEGRDG